LIFFDDKIRYDISISKTIYRYVRYIDISSLVLQQFTRQQYRSVHFPHIECCTIRRVSLCCTQLEPRLAISPLQFLLFIAKNKHLFIFKILVRPEAIAFRADLYFAGVYFSPRKISELRWPIVAKFCTMIGSVLSFIIPVQNFGGPLQKNFRGKNMQNLARLRSTSNFNSISRTDKCIQSPTSI